MSAMVESTVRDIVNRWFERSVDADASNRASLLFELRSQNARQFALYRVIASHPEQIFLTGTTQ